MTAYEALPPHVRAAIDRQAEAYAKDTGTPVEQARELIAARVTTTTYRPTQGTGH